jgi:exodeoxyribonuclease-3
VRITTWNVNGYRAAHQKGLREKIEAIQPDVLCLQEVKANPAQLPEELHTLPGYTSLWNPASKPGYSGVATFLRTPSLEFQFGMGMDQFDQEGRLIMTRHRDFLLFNIYFPNGQRGQERIEYKLAFYSALLEWCDRLHNAGEKIILTGDFNTAHREIDLAHPRQNATTSGFLPEERVWIDKYLEHQFYDAYRQLYPDKIEYTWWTYISNARSRNVGWRIDYFLVSQDLMPSVKEVVIHNDITGSDHCPVSIDLAGT